jgi:hypothetical protein
MSKQWLLKQRSHDHKYNMIIYENRILISTIINLSRKMLELLSLLFLHVLQSDKPPVTLWNELRLARAFTRRKSSSPFFFSDPQPLFFFFLSRLKIFYLFFWLEFLCCSPLHFLLHIMSIYMHSRPFELWLCLNFSLQI